MKHIILSVIFSCFFIYSKAQVRKSNFDDPILDSIKVSSQKKIGKNINSFNFSSASGKRFSNLTIRGSVTFLNFWFEGCAPCVAEFPEINKLTQVYAANKLVKVITFTFESPQRVKELIKKYNLKFEIISISESQCDNLNFGFGYPTTIILNKNGKISYIDFGGTTNKKEIENYFKINIFKKIDELLKNE